jgi:iron complex transport system substrate-binding protein
VIHVSHTRFAALLALLLILFTGSTQATETTCPRIVSQSPYITKTLQWLGLEACIVGVSRYDVLDLPHTGGVLDPDADLIAVLEPDLLFTSDWTDKNKLAAVTPEGTRNFRLGGFGSMAEIEQNLHTIGNAVGMADIAQRTAQFHHDWLEAAHRIHGKGKRVLLLSSCSGMPYSFGKERWLSDLFTRAGFVNVETEPKIRHIRPGQTVATLNALVKKLEPDLLFIFEQTRHKQCAFIAPKTPLTIINLNGEKFLHPAPVLLEGLAELQQQQSKWSH